MFPPLDNNKVLVDDSDILPKAAGPIEPDNDMEQTLNNENNSAQTEPRKKRLKENLECK